MRPHQNQFRKNLRGFSLVELLVGMGLALLVIVTIAQVLSVWDGRRRTITAGSGTQISGGIGILEIERDLQLSGIGYGNVSSSTIGCTVNAYNSSLSTPNYSFTLAPVQIIDGVNGAPDVINILYGNSAYVANIQLLQASTSTTKTLQYRAGFNAGDIILVAGDVATSTPLRQCALFEDTGNAVADAVSITHGTASYTSFYTAGSVTPTMNSTTAGVNFGGGEIYNLGPNPQRTQWAVSAAGVLTRTNTLRDTTTFEVADGVVNLQAQYGIDGSDGSASNGRIEDTEWTNTPPTDWTKLLAVRIAVLARSSQVEKTIVTPNAPVWAVTPSASAGIPFVMLNLDGSSGTTSVIANDWRYYRYRVYESIVPLRNMIWGATS